YQEAADLHQQTLTDRERVLGPDHPDTLSSRNNLAHSLHAAARRQRWRRPWRRTRSSPAR
ncbi:tetratricopeptide repeat protein, partial [Streptomyces microflavus]